MKKYFDSVTRRIRVKKMITLALCLALFSTCIPGCGNTGRGVGQDAATLGTDTDSIKTGESSADTVSSDEDVTTLSFWYINTDGMESYMPDGFVERFQAACPQYKLEITAVPGSAADFETKFNSAKMSSTLPDLCYLTLTSFASLGTRGEFLSLNDQVSTWDEKEDFLDASLDMGKIGGEYTGIGVAPAPVMLAYRTDMFEAAGISPENPPANWEELEECALKLTIKDDGGNVVQAGLDIPSIDYYLNVSQPFMLMNGATVVDEANAVPMLDEPEVIETLEYLYNLYSQGITLPHDWQKRETIPFMNGIGAMSFISVDNFNQLLVDHPELEGKVRMAPPVSNKTSAAFCGYRLLAATAGTEQAEGVWDLIQFFVSSDEMARRIDYGVIPVRTSIQDYYVETVPDIGQTILDTVAVGKGAFVVPWVSMLYKYYGPAYESVMQGMATPAAAMAEAQQQILAEIGQ